MDRVELESLIKSYINTNVRSANEQQRLYKLFLGEQEDSFISLWEQYGGDYGTAVREAVKARTSNKDRLITRFKRLTEYLTRHSQEDIQVDWPPAAVSNRVDRLICIMKILQTDTQDAVQLLSDKLWVSTRTIEDDLSSIRYENMVEPAGFLDQSFVINGIRRAHGSVSFLSSVHPMLLMENLTSVIVMTEALLEKAQQPACRNWAMITASHAWNQLTDYAKGRVEDVMHRTYDEGSSVLALFEELKAMSADGQFRTEQETARTTIDKAMYCFKASLNCRFICRERDGSLSEHIGYPFTFTDRDADVIRIRRADGVEEAIPLSSIEESEIIED